MSWNQGTHSYEVFWEQAPPQSQRSDNRSIPDIKPGKVVPRSPENDNLTDGQISVALDRDLLDLIDNINLELSRTSTDTTARTASSVTSGGSFYNLDFDNMPNVADQRFNSYGSQLSFGAPSRGGTRARNSFVAGRSGSFLTDVPVIVEGLNEDGSSPSSSTDRNAGPVSPQVGAPWSRPPVYNGPRSPQTLAGSSNQVSAPMEEPLPQVLHALDDEDDSRIVVVRRITKLGFKSNRTIKIRFQQLGWEVKNVVLLPSRARSLYPESGGSGPVGGTPASHARPSSMGFVVFKTKEAALECIKRGTINVEGIDVLVQPFVRQYKPSTSPTSGGSIQSST